MRLLERFVRIVGKLIKWNDDRGFGFIQADSGGPEVFVHVSAFPGGRGRPTLGDRVSFEISVDEAGKKRAVSVKPVETGKPRRKQSSDREKPGMVGALINVAMLLAVGYGIYLYVDGRFPGARQVVEVGDFGESTVVTTSDDGKFRCDGRQHCSQMSSCAEARFFNRHCPGTKMDGDHDGEPCERGPC